MAHESLSLSELIPATEEEIYSAWLDSVEHAAFTGNAASIDPVVGGRHSTFAGYAQGSILDLEPPQRIVETWRTTDFPEDSPDSRVEVTLEPTVGGTMVTLLHTEIPEGQSNNYRDSWVKYYFEPMKSYFRRKNATVVDVVPEAFGPDDMTENETVPNGTASRKPARAKTRPAPERAVETARPAAAKPRAKVKQKAKPAAKAKTAIPAKSNASKASKASKTSKASTKTKLRARAATKTKSKAKTKAPVRGNVKAKAKGKATAKAKTARRKQARPAKKRR